MPEKVNVLERLRRSRAFPSEPLFLALFSTTLTALAFLFPPTGDDLRWGTAIGADRFHRHFEGYNGRYLGNLAVLVLTRTSYLTPFVIAVTFTMILWLLLELSGRRTPAGYLIGAGLLVAMPLGQWRQTVVWTSGFTNYALASFCMLVFLLHVKRDWTTGWRRPRLTAATTLPFAVASLLFIEHVSLYLVLASVINLALLARRRRPLIVAATWALGSVIGAFVMFSNSAYRAAVSGTSRYHDVGASDPAAGSGGLIAIIKQGTGGVSQLAVTTNTVLNAALVIAVFALAVTSRHATGRLNGLQIAAVISAMVGAAGSAAVVSAVSGKNFGPLTPWSWVPALALLIAIVLTTLTLVEDSGRRRSIIVSTLSFAVLTAPMAAVSPYGPRNFLPTYLLLVGAVLVLSAELSSRIVAPQWDLAVAGVGAAVLVTVMAGYFAVYAELHHQVDERVASIRRAAEEGKHSARIQPLGYPGYLHAPDPRNPSHRLAFKRYYDLPLGMRIRVVRK